MPLLHDIAHLAHAELLTPEPEKSLWFFTEILGLTENGRSGDSVYLRTWDDYEHHSLKLTLSGEKTLITHARTQAARFLGYNIVVFHNDQKRDKSGKRSINGQIGLQAPVEVIQAKCALYQKNGKPTHRKERTDDTVYSIISQYQQEFRGFAEYYQLAVNRYQLNRLKWVMERSLVATLAHKLRVSVSKAYKR